MSRPLEKVSTGIAGLDEICRGGLPAGRVTLIAGSSGAAKTIVAGQFLMHGAEAGENAVLITCEETPEDIRANFAGFGWEPAALEAAGRWAFVDASPRPETAPSADMPCDLSGLIAQVRYQIQQTGARRVAVDSISTLLGQFENRRSIRIELLRLANTLKELGVTAVLTAERLEEYGAVARFGVENFVTDAVIILRHVLAKDQVRRTAQVLKYRGSSHLSGEFPFVIGPRGVQFLPMSMHFDTELSGERCSWGNDDMDRLSGGGPLRESISMVSGATGTGKSLLASYFLADAIRHGERALYLSYEESAAQVARNAGSLDLDFEAAVAAGLLRIEAHNPAAINLPEHLIWLQQTIAEHRPLRISLDSLSALGGRFARTSFEEFAIGLACVLRESGTTVVITNAAKSLIGVEGESSTHLSALADTVILLRYVEVQAEMQRGIAVLRMRGSAHDTAIRRFTVGADGYHIGQPFREVGGILAGAHTQLAKSECDELGGMFED